MVTLEFGVMSSVGCANSRRVATHQSLQGLGTDVGIRTWWDKGSGVYPC